MKINLLTFDSPSGSPTQLHKFLWQGKGLQDTFAIVGALHGDNFNALKICSQLIEFFDRIEKDESADCKIQGKVLLFPTLNIQASQTGQMVWPADGLNSNLSFPGSRQGEQEEQMALAVYEEIFDVNAGIVIESGSRHYEDVPHLKCHKAHSEERKMAFASGLSIMREIEPSPAYKAQLFSQWAERSAPALILSGGTPGLLSQSYCDIAFQGILKILLSLKILKQNTKFEAEKRTTFFSSRQETIIRCQRPGLFQSSAKAGANLKQGEAIGNITDPLTGKVIEEIIAPEKGTLVTVRQLPIIYKSEPVAILMTEKKKGLWPF